MNVPQIKSALTAAGVKPYAMTEINGGPDFHVSFDDLPHSRELEAAIKGLAGHFDQTDKGIWFFAA